MLRMLRQLGRETDYREYFQTLPAPNDLGNMSARTSFRFGWRR
jgi:hypothetical protein